MRQPEPVELRDVRLRLARNDTFLTRLAGPERMRGNGNPVAVDVRTARAYDPQPRDASLEIYLDGEMIGDTWPLPPDRLIAFVADPSALRAGMQVTVAWLGDEERTRSREPVVLTEVHLRAIR